MTHDLSTQEAAEKLGVTERTIRNWIDEGVIHAYKLNPNSKSVYRIPVAEIEQLLSLREKPRTHTSAKR